ncbi:MAG: DUF4290 domain-containing protein [Flavobacteriales bacterium]
MDYNTQLPKLIIPEYGRNVQRMIEYLLEIEDLDKRNHQAKAVIEVMGNLNPHLRNIPDYRHKLWDHLFIMSDFKLDVETPYDKPDEEILNTKPERMAYSQSQIKLRHFGKHVLGLIKKACTIEDETTQKDMALAIANQMKKCYVTWNNSTVDDVVIIRQMNRIAETELLAEDTSLNYVTVPKNSTQTNRNQKHQKHKHQKQQNGKKNNDKYRRK